MHGDPFARRGEANGRPDLRFGDVLRRQRAADRRARLHWRGNRARRSPLPATRRRHHGRPDPALYSRPPPPLLHAALLDSAIPTVRRWNEPPRSGVHSVAPAGDLEASVRLALLLLVGIGLSGCAGGSVISHSYYTSAYSPDHVQLAAASGTAIATIRNNPFPQDSGNAGVLAAMQGRNVGPRMYFSQTARPDDKYGYRVILDFGRPGSSFVYQCQGESTTPATASSSGSIDVTATFCSDRLLTDASGTV